MCPFYRTPCATPSCARAGCRVFAVDDEGPPPAIRALAVRHDLLRDEVSICGVRYPGALFRALAANPKETPMDMKTLEKAIELRDRLTKLEEARADWIGRRTSPGEMVAPAAWGQAVAVIVANIDEQIGAIKGQLERL